MVGEGRGRNEDIKGSRCPLEEEFLPWVIKSASSTARVIEMRSKKFVGRSCHIILRMPPPSLRSQSLVCGGKSSIRFCFVLRYSWCTVLYKFQVYNIVIHNFKGYIPFIVIVKYCLYSPCCTEYPCSLF